MENVGMSGECTVIEPEDKSMIENTILELTYKIIQVPILELPKIICPKDVEVYLDRLDNIRDTW